MNQINTTGEVEEKKVMLRKDEITRDFLRLADQFIDDLLHYRVYRKLHAKDFGAMMFIHPRHLTQVIKLTTGQSPCDIIEVKLTGIAKNLLVNTQRPVADIGMQLSYKDATNFIKFFKGMTGISPLQYRKQHQDRN